MGLPVDNVPYQPGKKINPADTSNLDVAGPAAQTIDVIPKTVNPADPYDNTQTDGTLYAPPPAPAPPPPAPAPPPPDAPPPGLLNNPGPYEIWASTHGAQFDDPSAAENLYSKYGAGLMDDKSNIETLYGQGIGQLNPYYDYASQIGTKSINDAAAAHGGFSSTALNQIGLLNANLRGQQSKDMAAMAAQADAAKLARYGVGETEAEAADKGKLDRAGAGANIYSTWQDKEESRLMGGLTSQMTLSDAQSKQADTFYTNLMQAGQYDAAGINAALQAAGVDPNSAFAKDLVSTGQMIVKAYATGK